MSMVSETARPPDNTFNNTVKRLNSSERDFFITIIENTFKMPFHQLHKFLKWFETLPPELVLPSFQKLQCPRSAFIQPERTENLFEMVCNAKSFIQSKYFLQKTFLKEYAGVLQVDGYAGYNDLAAKDTITRAACMAHVRRKFDEALSYNKVTSEYALSTSGRWFDIEKEAVKANLTHVQRYDMRQDIMVEEFAAFRTWMLSEVGNHIPKSPARKAMEYALGQWPGFAIFLADGRVELSNNWVENAIRPVALGRKNYLFKGSEPAAQRGAIIYSIVSTAKLNGKEPREYIKYLLEKLPTEKSANLENYLPWIVNL